ncbi:MULTISPECIES: septum formation initiator family protein [Peptoniphilus]|uniref:FtsB family cell division protein n=1 Tax=Peptoniphilus TaxID=162289 RepID=UPI00030F7905|nr:MULTISPECIES: septum formation initiator family protein [Peptoniphilus]
MKQKKFFPILCAIIILSSVIYGAFVVSNSASEKHNKMAEILSNDKEIEQLKKDIENLKAEIGNSDSTEFIEKVAREDLGMVKPREIIYIDKEKVSKNDNNLLESN